MLDESFADYLSVMNGFMSGVWRLSSDELEAVMCFF
jgi:hypothetical protein